MPSKASFSIMNIIYSKPRNRLLHERVDKLDFISINTRTRVREDMEIEAEIIEKRAKQEDRLLLKYNTNQTMEALIEADKIRN